MTEINPLASPHLPAFITAPGQTDVLFVIMAVVLVGAVLGIGVFFLWLHSLPERMVHNKIQFDIVAVLALLSLFTHQHAFWVAALLIALVNFPSFKLPDFANLLGRIASSLETIAASSRIEAADSKSLPHMRAKTAEPEPLIHAKAKTADVKPLPHAEAATADPKSARHTDGRSAKRRG
jgi:multisubunit Na+/H+ antiporter MnhF subunit